MNTERRNILKMPVSVTNPEDAITRILGAAGENGGRYVCVANVHMCMEAYDAPDFNQVVSNANLIVPDGVPIVWSLKALGEKSVGQVRGSDLMLRLCEEASRRNISIGLYGGTPETIGQLRSVFTTMLPGLRIACAIAPPFRPLTPEEDDAYTNTINKSGIKILFVGIGCPKQEDWMASHRERLSCVMLGVGAAFDFFSGAKKHAPRWLQKSGLEWAFRLSQDPRRLWKRYLKHNPRFVWHFGKQLIGYKFQSSFGKMGADSDRSSINN